MVASKAITAFSFTVIFAVTFWVSIRYLFAATAVVIAIIVFASTFFFTLVFFFIIPATVAGQAVCAFVLAAIITNSILVLIIRVASHAFVIAIKVVVSTNVFTFIFSYVALKAIRAFGFTVIFTWGIFVTIRYSFAAFAVIIAIKVFISTNSFTWISSICSWSIIFIEEFLLIIHYNSPSSGHS